MMSQNEMNLLVPGESNLPPSSSSCSSMSCSTEKIDSVRPELSLEEVRMLETLSNKEDLLVKSQQRGDPDLSNSERLEILKEIFIRSPGEFLARFGMHLHPEDLTCFEKHCKFNYAVNFHLNELKIGTNSKIKQTKAKNRRYGALHNLVDTTDYFTEAEMHRRNPILYDQLIGKYHSKEEREAFLQLMFTRSAAATSECQATPLTDMFMAHMDRNETVESSNRRLIQEHQLEEEGTADAEYMEDDEEEMDDDVDIGMSNNIDMEDECREEIEDEEKELLKEEFFTTMYRSFLEGKDADFDYSTVDDNADYDIGETFEQDEEDKYFESEEAADVFPDMEHLDLEEDHFVYPKRPEGVDNTPESNSFEATVENSKHTQNVVTMKDASNVPVTESDDEEDDLDKYMRIIEDELKNKK